MAILIGTGSFDNSDSSSTIVSEVLEILDPLDLVLEKRSFTDVDLFIVQ